MGLGPSRSQSLLVGRVQAQWVPGLVLAHWWVGLDLGSRTSVIPEMSKARTWCLAAGPRDPRAGVGPLVDGAGF